MGQCSVVIGDSTRTAVCGYYLSVVSVGITFSLFHYFTTDTVDKLFYIFLL